MDVLGNPGIQTIQHPVFVFVFVGLSRVPLIASFVTVDQKFIAVHEGNN